MIIAPNEILETELRVAQEQRAILRALAQSLEGLAELESEHGSRLWTKALDSIRTALRLTA